MDERRATVDVDLLVPRDKLAAIANALVARGYRARPHVDVLHVYGGGAPRSTPSPI